MDEDKVMDPAMAVDGEMPMTPEAEDMEKEGEEEATDEMPA